MEQTAKLIDSISSLLWPLMALLVIVLFRPAMTAIIDSAKSRKFSLKIGGQELTMEEANEQQRTLISDLQSQLIDLRDKIEGRTDFAQGHSETVSSADALPARTILWVDDNPKNNSYLIEEISNTGAHVDLALSTAQGIAMFVNGKYQCIISDMGRAEAGNYNGHAGIDLLRAIRQKNLAIPFIIFCGRRGIQEFGEQATSEGVTTITSSPTDLFGILKLDQAKRT